MPYRLYLDESGTDDVSHCDEEEHRYLGLTAVIIERAHCRNFCVPDLARIKREIFDHDPDRPPCLHREDINNYRREFKILRDDVVRAKFDAQVLKFIEEAEYTVITAVIDKLEMLKQVNWTNKEPYHYLMEVIVEKYAQFLKRKNDTGDIMPEMRRGKDRPLQSAYLRIWQSGTRYASKSLIQERIPAQTLKFRDKDHNIAGLQLCDLIAHPSAKYVRIRAGHAIALGPFGQKIVRILREKKYDRSPWFGTIWGYGIKYLPTPNKKRGG